MLEGRNDQLLLKLEGHQGDGWVTKSVCLPRGKYSLAFKATVGVMFKSDIAIDDIQLLPQNCILSTSKMCSSIVSIEVISNMYF